MADLVITKAKGGFGRPAEMTVIPPQRQVNIESLRAVAKDAGLNGLFIADSLSSFAMHARAASRFGLAAARQAGSPEMSQLHSSLAHAHMAALQTIEALMRALGVDPQYASPLSRMAHFLDGGLLAAPRLGGSVDAPAMAAVLLDIALAMVERSQCATQTLRAITAAAKPSRSTDALRAAVERLEADIGATLNHVRQTREQLLVACATAQHTG